MPRHNGDCSCGGVEIALVKLADVNEPAPWPAPARDRDPVTAV